MKMEATTMLHGETILATATLETTISMTILMAGTTCSTMTATFHQVSLTIRAFTLSLVRL
jgi:hypothetical protein